jgi:hypothetical protein
VLSAKWLPESPLIITPSWAAAATKKEPQAGYAFGVGLFYVAWPYAIQKGLFISQRRARVPREFRNAHLRARRQRTRTRTDIDRRGGQIGFCQTRTDRLAARCESKVGSHCRRALGTH